MKVNDAVTFIPIELVRSLCQGFIPDRVNLFPNWLKTVKTKIIALPSPQVREDHLALGLVSYSIKCYAKHRGLLLIRAGKLPADLRMSAQQN
jgi:hypothetical protein